VSGSISTSGTNDNNINVFNGSFTVTGGMVLSGTSNNVALSNSSLATPSLEGNPGTNITVGDEMGAGALTADNVAMGGGHIGFDPPFISIGNDTNASLGALIFNSNTVDGSVDVGRNSMVSLGSTDAEWLRTEVRNYQNAGNGLWGQDITAALVIRAPQTLAAGGGIQVDGAWLSDSSGAADITASNARFADQSLLIVDANGVAGNVALSGGGWGGTLDVDAGARLHIVGGMGGDTLVITDNFSAGAEAGWLGNNVTTGSGLLSAMNPTFASGKYSVTLRQNAATSVFPLLSLSMGRLVDSVFGQTPINTDSSNPGVRFLSRAVDDSYIGRSNTTLAAATIEGAAQLAVVGAVPGMTLSAAEAATSAATTRTSFASPLLDKSKATAVNLDKDGKVSLDTGLSAGSGMKNGIGLWIMPLYQSNHAWGMKAENFKTGYNADLGGLSFGADYTFADAFRFGLALSLGGGYAQSSGDFNKTENRFQFWGVSLYGGWTQDNFGLTADVGYTGTYNDLRQESPVSMQMGELKADVNSHAITAGLRGEYKFATPFLDVIPHVSGRYTSLNIDKYDVKNGGTVFRVDQSHQSIWTFPVGLSFSKDIDVGKGWTFRPLLDASIIPAAGDVKTKSKSRIPGVGTSAELETQVVDYMTWQGGAGFDIKSDNLSFGINYIIQASEHRTGHGVFGTLRYDF
jgi:hypothetical protein